MGLLTRRSSLVGLFVLASFTPSVHALETDQFYAWLSPIEDGTEVVNAWMRAEIEAVVTESNASDRLERPCEDLAWRIRRRLYFFIFQEIELWATHTPTLDRIPKGFEETLHYRDTYLFRTDNPFDLASWMPPSPTIEIDGVRLGTDKLSHFASLGWMYFDRYREAIERGADPKAAVEEAIRFGLLSERTIFGASSTGALSLADLEANYQGMLFYMGLCHGADPMLERHPATGWRIRHPFDIREFVSPEWDESWNPPIYRSGRWSRVREVLVRHCEELEHPRVRARRAAYRERDVLTPTEGVVKSLVEAGRLSDPAQFDIETVCGTDPE